MTLSATVLALLAACANSMAEDKVITIDLHDSFSREFHCDEIAGELARCVEESTHGQLTVRSADPALFASQVKGQALYLVLCPNTTPSGVVTELSSAMRLYCLGPYSNGFKQAGQASPEEVERYRAFADGSNRRRSQNQHGKTQAEALLSKLTEALRVRINACENEAQRNDASYALRSSAYGSSLEPIAAACAALNIPLAEFIGEHI